MYFEIKDIFTKGNLFVVKWRTEHQGDWKTQDCKSMEEAVTLRNGLIGG